MTLFARTRLAGKFTGDRAVLDVEGLFDLLLDVESLVAGEVVGVEFLVAAGAANMPELVVGSGTILTMGDVAFGVDLIDHDAGDTPVAEPGERGVGDNEFAAFDGDVGFVDEAGDGPVGHANTDSDMNDRKEFGGQGSARLESLGVPEEKKTIPDQTERDEEEDG